MNRPVSQERMQARTERHVCPTCGGWLPPDDLAKNCEVCRGLRTRSAICGDAKRAVTFIKSGEVPVIARTAVDGSMSFDRTWDVFYSSGASVEDVWMPDADSPAGIVFKKDYDSRPSEWNRVLSYILDKPLDDDLPEFVLRNLWRGVDWIPAIVIDAE